MGPGRRPGPTGPRHRDRRTGFPLPAGRASFAGTHHQGSLGPQQRSTRIPHRVPQPSGPAPSDGDHYATPPPWRFTPTPPGKTLTAPAPNRTRAGTEPISTRNPTELDEGREKETGVNRPGTSGTRRAVARPPPALSPGCRTSGRAARCGGRRTSARPPRRRRAADRGRHRDRRW